MRKTARLAACAGAALALCATAHAQSSFGTGSGSSLIPYTSSGYVGLNAGTSDYRGSCVAGFNCDDKDDAFKIYAGGMFNDWLGLELGYLNLGWVDRNAGRTRAHGVNVSLVGKVPMDSPFMLYGRLGTTWGRTNNESPLPGYSGTISKWKPAWGVGVGYQFNKQWAVVLDYDRTQFEFANSGDDDVDSLTVGVRFGF